MKPGLEALPYYYFETVLENMIVGIWALCFSAALCFSTHLFSRCYRGRNHRVLQNSSSFNGMFYKRINTILHKTALSLH